MATAPEGEAVAARGDGDVAGGRTELLALTTAVPVEHDSIAQHADPRGRLGCHDLRSPQQTFGALVLAGFGRRARTRLGTREGHVGRLVAAHFPVRQHQPDVLAGHTLDDGATGHGPVLQANHVGRRRQ